MQVLVISDRARLRMNASEHVSVWLATVTQFNFEHFVAYFQTKVGVNSSQFWTQSMVLYHLVIASVTSLVCGLAL